EVVRVNGLTIQRATVPARIGHYAHSYGAAFPRRAGEAGRRVQPEGEIGEGRVGYRALSRSAAFPGRAGGVGWRVQPEDKIGEDRICVDGKSYRSEVDLRPGVSI